MSISILEIIRTCTSINRELIIIIFFIYLFLFFVVDEAMGLFLLVVFGVESNQSINLDRGCMLW